MNGLGASSPLLLAAPLIGLASTFHCFGMCGGVMALLTLNLPPDIRQNRWRLLPYLLSYNLGRILSYSLMGALVAGSIGVTAAQLPGSANLRMLLGIVAALLLTAMGLYIAGWWPGFSRIETLGKPLWRRLEPIARKLRPASPLTALPFGAAWGWLPCGMVYSALLTAGTSGSAINGALFMLLFGSGTLPALLLLGLAGKTGAWLKNPWLRRALGLSLLALAVASLWFNWPATPGASHHHH
ncbi:MAG: sulfite exporter TauE/SafE family protein [Gammaproteobacteria bacterium]|nr:sulfite exporter TauE/SafE family protein [Gammaproteobacteria bacterium]